MKGQGPQGQPYIILSEGTERETGRTAQSNNIMAGKAVADAVRSTLGPRGMDKMLVDATGEVVITNDGATILKQLDIEHPAAKMMVEVARSLDSECGDGTTTSVVIAGDLLKRAGELLGDVHATLVNRGFHLAAEKAVELFEAQASSVTTKDKAVLNKVAQTAMASKLSGGHVETLSPIAVDAVLAVAEETPDGVTVDKDDVALVKKAGGSVDETTLLDGLLLEKARVHPDMPKRVEKAKILLVNKAIEVQKTEFSSEIQISDPSQLSEFLEQEKGAITGLVDLITATGANVVLCQKGIDDVAQHMLAKAGIYAINRVKKSDMERLAKATGANVVNNLDDISKDDLGKAGLVEERIVAEDSLTFVTGCKKAKAVSVLIRGGTAHVIDEVERTLEDAVGAVASALEAGAVVPGAGAAEIEVAMRLRDYASSVGGREQLAVEAFADALEIVPRTLAENAGMDAIQTLVDLRSAHESGKKTYGVLVTTGKIGDAVKANAVDPLRVKVQAVRSATEAATLILRIDDVIASKGGDGDAGGPPGGMGGGMPPGMGGMGGMPGMM